MELIDYDIRDRKKLASASRYKKNGSKSKKCTLPSDSLSEAKWKKMNGEIKVYQIGKPGTWGQFKEYPKEMQKEYLKHFAERFGCSSGMVADMFGTTQNTLSVYLCNNALQGILKRKPSAKDKACFSEWLTAQREQKDDAASVVEEQNPIDAPKLEKRARVQTMTGGTFHLEGKAGEIMQQLFEIFQDAELVVDFGFHVKGCNEE